MSVESFMSGFGFSTRTEFVRQRAAIIPDPYDPDAPGVPSWDDPNEVVVLGYLASMSSAEQVDEVRAEVVSDAQLILDDPGADVQRGDRIRGGGKLWVVEGFPAADVNPWTAWRPTLVCNLREVVG